MPAALAETVGPLRILRRQPVQRKHPIPLYTRKPSLLDHRLRGDPWIVTREEGRMALCFDCWEMASVGGLALDLPSLNAQLMRLRRRTPRRS